VPLLEKCLTEDPVHERALLLLTDCLLATSGSVGAAAARSRTGSAKSWRRTEAEIKTILEKEEAAERAATFLSKNEEQMNKFYASTRYRFDKRFFTSYKRRPSALFLFLNCGRYLSSSIKHTNNAF
jgi:hypothetical protein